MCKRVGLLAAVLVIAGALGHPSAARAAEDGKTQSARDEVERELGQMVKTPPPPELVIVYDGIDSGRYSLVEAEFELDGAPIKLGGTPSAEGQNQELFRGALTLGNHTVLGKLTFQEGGNKVFTYMKGSKYKLPARWTFVGERGLRVRLHSSVEVDDGQRDPKKKLELKASVEPQMMTAVDDGSIPPPLARRHLDAGTELASAKAAKKANAEKEDKAAEDVKEPKPTSTKTAGDEDTAASSRRHASTSETGTGTHPPAAADGADAGALAEADAGVLDAGTAVAETVVDAGAPVAVAPVQPSGPNVLPWILGGGVVLVGLVLFFALRRRK